MVHRTYHRFRIVESERHFAKQATITSALWGGVACPDLLVSKEGLFLLRLKSWEANLANLRYHIDNEASTIVITGGEGSDLIFNLILMEAHPHGNHSQTPQSPRPNRTP